MPKALANNRNNFLSLAGVVDKHEYWLNQSLNNTDSPEFFNISITGNAIIQGDLTVNGSTSVISTDILEIKDNLIQINSTETNAGVSAGISGIEIKRGTLGAYHFIFRESDDTFRVGEQNFTQAVATREDAPISNGVMIYNEATSRLDATNIIQNSLTMNSGEVSTNSSSGALRVSGGLGVSGNSNFDSRVYFKGSNYSNYIQSNISNEFVMNSSGNILLTAANSNYVKIPASVGLSLGGISHNITGDGSNITINSSGQINVLGTAVSLRNGSPLLFSTNDKITLNTDLIVDAASNLVINPKTKILNTTASTTNSNGALIISGGISISNTTDAVSTTNGGTFTTAGGVSIAKKLYVGGDSTMNSITAEDSNIKNLTVGGGSGDSSVCNLTSSGNFTESVATSGATVTKAVFNSFKSGTLNSTNPVTTLTSANVYIEGAPSAGSNQTINNTYALLVDSGNSKMNGNLQLGSLNVNGNTTTDTMVSSDFTTDKITIASNTIQESEEIQIFNEINAPTLTSGSAFTTGLSATLSVSGPIAGTNQTITNSSAILVKTGNITVLTTNPSNSSSASILTAGGITITNTTEATSNTDGGTFTTAGGVAIAKKLYVGGDSILSGNLTNNTTFTKNIITTGDITGNYSEAAVTLIGGNVYNDQSLSGNVNNATGSLYKQTTFNYGSPVTVAEAATVRISTSPIAGTNATFTKSYGLVVDTASRFNMVEFGGGITAENTLSVSGLSSLAQTSISTNTGQFTIAGSNGISANVTGTVNVQGAGITLDSSAGLTLDGSSSLTLATTGASSISSGVSSSISVASGTLSITAPTTTFTSDTLNLVADVVNFGTNISDMIMAGNMTIGGNFTVQGTYTTINSQTVTVNDNVIVVNSMPLGISDGGLLVKRFQIPNNDGSGKVVLDSPLVTGSFRSGSSTPGTLVLSDSGSSTENHYRGYWIKITSGVCEGYIRRLKTYDGTTKIATIYLTEDNREPITDGMDMTSAPSSGDTYELFIGAYSGLFYSEIANRWVMGKVPFDNGAGTFPLEVYDDIQVNSLLIAGDFGFTRSLGVTVDSDDAFYVGNNTYKVFNVNTDDSILTLSNLKNTVGTKTLFNYSMYNTLDAQTNYTQTESEIVSSNTGKFSLKVLNSGTLETYLEATGTTLSSTKNLSVAGFTSDSIESGDITVENCTVDTIVSSQTSVGIPSFTTRSIGTRYVYKGQLSGTEVDYAVGVSEDSLYHTIPEATASYFHSWFAGTTEIMALSGTGTLSVADIDIAGNITGTWNGTTVTVEYGGTGATSFTSGSILLGNGSSAIQTNSDLSYSSNTLNTQNINATNSTDSTSNSTGSIITAGGIGVTKSVKIGTTLSINTAVSTSDINLAGDAVISNSSIDGSDNGSLSLSGGGLPLDTRGAYLKLYGNESGGNLVISAGNVSSTGAISFITGNSARLTVNYNGSLAVSSTLDSTSSVGSIVTSGGISVAKKVYVGTDLTVIGTISGTFQGTTVDVAYGGTGASTFTSNRVLLGNGTSAIQTNSNLSFSSDTLSTTKISLSETTQSSSISTGTFVTSGGIGIAKNCYVGENSIVLGNLSVGTATQTSELTLGSSANIGIDTTLNSDTGFLTISGSGSSSSSRGAVVKMYGIDNANTGKLSLNSGAGTGASIDFVTNASVLEIGYDGISTFKNTTSSSSSTTGAVVITGGLGISKTTDAVSKTEGGALTIAGGAAINKSLYVGGNLIVTGSISGGATITNPTLVFSSLNLISGISQYSCNMVNTGSLRNLTITLVAATTSAGDAYFEFVLPGVTSLTAYSVVANVSGYYSDFAIQNIITREIVSTTRAKLQFTSAGTGDHVLQCNITYSV